MIASLVRATIKVGRDANEHGHDASAGPRCAVYRSPAVAPPAPTDRSPARGLYRNPLTNIR
jgi:hypothetical protein